MDSWPKSLLPAERDSVYASSMKSTPPVASSNTEAVFSAVWPRYWPTRSRLATSRKPPPGRMPSAASNLP